MSRTRRPDGSLSWDQRAPRRAPFVRSDRWVGLRATGRTAGYADADTWYPAWGADGRLYSPFTDGLVGDVESWSVALDGVRARTGNAVIDGDDPMRLRVTALGVEYADADPYLGRYPSANLVHDGVWYVGTYCVADSGRGLPNDVLGPFVGFRWSLDGGETWRECPRTPSDPLFRERPGGPVRLGAPHAVDLGQDGGSGHQGHVYLVGHGSASSTDHLTWVSGDAVFLARARISPSTVNDPDVWEFAAGTHPVADQDRLVRGGELRWSRDLEAAAPLLQWPGHLGSVTITRTPWDRYVMCVTDGWPGITEMDSYVLEAPVLSGPWRLVAHLDAFGPQGYFLTFPSKFLDPDRPVGWLCYSANYTPTFLPGALEPDPPSSRYGLCLLEVEFLGPEATR